MIRDLSLRQLVKREASGPGGARLSIHRSLQLSILHSLSCKPEKRLQIFQQALSLIRGQLPPPSNIQAWRADLFESYAIYVPQLISLHAHSLWPEPKINLSLDLANVMIDIGTYMWRTGQYKQTEDMLDTAERILEREGLPEEHVLYSDIDDILGVICDRGGALYRQDAFRRRLRALSIREKAFAVIPPGEVTLDDKIRLYNAHANLACTYIQDENFDEANKIMDRCLEQYKSWGTEDEIPGEYSKYYHHAAFGIMMRGNVQEAINMLTRSLELQAHRGGKLQPMYIAYKCRLGIVLYHAGNIPESLRVLEECVSAFKTTVGDTNAQTLDTCCFMAGILLQTGEIEKAM